MKPFLIAALLAVSCVAFAAEPAAFELRAVSDAPGATTIPHPLPQRDGSTETVHLESAVLLDHAAIDSAKVRRDSSGNPAIYITLKKSGRKRFGEITTAHINKRIAILVAGRLLTAPVVREPIHGGEVQISGNFTDEEARGLAAMLNAAAAAKAP
jgi:preprotein translocase subunit SecD